MGILNIFNLLGRGREQKTLNLLDEEMKTVHQTVIELKGVLEDLRNLDVKGLEERRQRISTLEHKSDGIKRRVEEEIYRGAFLPMSRSRILNFAEEVDEIANVTQDVSNMTVFFEEPINQELYDVLSKHLEVTIECVESLMEGFKCLDNHAGIKKCIIKVEEKEHEADLLEYSAFKLMYKKLDGAKQLLTTSKLIEFIGRISNKAEDASDTLSLIVLMHKP